MADNRIDLEPDSHDHSHPPFRLFFRLPMLSGPSSSPGSTGRVGAGDATGAAVPSADPLRVLDPQALARLSDLDPTGKNHLIERVLGAFQTSATRLRPQAEAARASGDRATLRLVVHTLKSSSASIGATRLSQLCARIETTIRLDTLQEPDVDLDSLGAALDEVLRAIEPLLKGQA